MNSEINLEKYARIEGLGAQSRGDPGRWLFWGRNKDGQTSQEAFVVLRWRGNGLNLRVGTGTASFSYILSACSAPGVWSALHVCWGKEGLGWSSEVSEPSRLSETFMPEERVTGEGTVQNPMARLMSS